MRALFDKHEDEDNLFCTSPDSDSEKGGIARTNGFVPDVRENFCDESEGSDEDDAMQVLVQLRQRA